MRHRKNHGVKLGRRAGARAQLIRSLAVSLLLHERIRTTAAKSRAARSLVERCITIGRANELLRRRALTALLGHQRAVRKVLEVIGPRYKTRTGGYTRITRVGHRLGDGAPEVILELV